MSFRSPRCEPWPSWTSSGPPSQSSFVDPGADFLARVRDFAARFGLTGAETRVLAEIIGGAGLLAAATKLKITETTARTHLNRIFAKTRTHRQAELIRRFFETSLPRPPAR
ncbi:MAG TPA: hypothetical protein VME69_04720 [Methylocella sp.]|nr:hypothetical protein [Methylocella sp.]